jgi:hypothetical protein
MPIIMQELREILKNSFARAEDALLTNRPIVTTPAAQHACDVVFVSHTQAYREVLLGCLLVRNTDSSKDICLPYIDLGPNAFSGRSIDEQVVKMLPEYRRPSKTRSLLKA